jgi:COP9 signalosome complex subunit 6
MEHEEKTLTTLIHPVSMMIISNHFTRMALLNDGKLIPVVGALLGKQESRSIEVLNCFEVETKQENDKWVLNKPHFEEREKMYQETFPNQSFLGFYVVGDHQNVDEFDQYLHGFAASTSELTVVVLKMSPLIDPSNDKIPVNVFESVFDSAVAKNVLTPVNVKIVSESGEQISTDHAAKSTSGADKHETTASKKLVEQSSALKMLLKGLTVSMNYLKAVDQAKLQMDPEVFRELNKLAIKLQFLQQHVVKPESGNCTLNDKLIVLLSMDNKVSGSIFSIINKLNTIINEHNNPGPPTPMKRKELF